MKTLQHAVEPILNPRNWPGMVESHSLPILGLILCFVVFSRTFTFLLELPNTVNFLHFFFVLALFLATLRKSVGMDLRLPLLIVTLLVVIVISAILNHAGVANIVVDFLFLAEPFMFLNIMVNLNHQSKHVQRFRGWLILLGVAQIPAAYLQLLLLGHGDIAYYIGQTPQDLIKGTILGKGNGHHLLGALSVMCAAYTAYYYRERIFWVKYVLIGLLLGIPIVNDAKQSLLAGSGAYMVLWAAWAKSRHVRILWLIAIGAVVLAACLAWDNPKMWRPNFTVGAEDGLCGKFAAVCIFGDYFQSLRTWVIGMGPGHTVGKLAFFFGFPEFEGIRTAMGGTVNTFTDSIWRLWGEHPKIPRSSLFTTFFSWAGILGDLGVAGICTYIATLACVQAKYCVDNLSRLLLVFAVILGMISTWLEEPVLMLYLMAIIGQVYCARNLPDEPAYTRTNLERKIDRVLDFVIGNPKPLS